MDQTAFVANTVDISARVRAVSVVQPFEIYTVTKPDVLADPSWHPDGTSIIFVELSGSDWTIATMNIGATPNHTVLLTAPNPFGDPMWSSDGNFVLFSYQDSPPDMTHPHGAWSLLYMRKDGTDVRTILQDDNANIHAVWVSPTQVAFEWWGNGATPADISWLSLININGLGRIDLGEGEYPRTVVQ